MLFAMRYCAMDGGYFQREQAWLKLACSYECRQLQVCVASLSEFACAVCTRLLSARTQILPSRTANLPIIRTTPPEDAIALGSSADEVEGSNKSWHPPRAHGRTKAGARYDDKK